ncbi:hypothetical protein ZIOFF_002941 [Zingiber officinale]|uniref:Uncharacterized protein n=1 Tax=Zingiber officinale TaxID=94328 RepID=A0A8J5LT24_ZINOF|nr:hypothetical protein ZIOFF_002941 [Zingiber officinale]
MHDINGTKKGFYDGLRWYYCVIQETNPGSVAECEIDPVTSKFKSDRWGVMNNSIDEYWNNWVKPARYLPIVAMVYHIRMQIMNIMHRRCESILAIVKELSLRKEKAIARVYLESRNLRVH